MKKIYLVLMGVAALSFATLSCSKEVADPSLQEQNQKEETVKDEPAKEDPSGDTPVPEGMIRLTFGVSQEGDASANEGDDTKTSWNGTTHAWSNGDQIRIIVGEGNVEGTDYVDAEVVDGKVTAVVPDAAYYYAVYPTTATYTFTAAEGKISVSFGRNQGGTFKDANIMAAKTSKAAASFNFKNMTSILKFTTAVGSPYTKIDFAANDKVKLNGTVSTNFEEPFDVETSSTGSYTDMLTTDIAADGTYYLAVLPGTTLSNGIGFKVTKSGAQSTGSLSTSSLSMERCAIRTLPVAIDELIHESWFITETGSGKKDGTSWENAGDAARLVQLIYPTQTRGTGQGLTAAWRLHKATIYVAAGTYNIQAANGGDALAPSYSTSTLTTTIKGGYPTGLSGTTTSGQDVNNNITIFQCNQLETADRVFAFTETFSGDITFDGIQFPANGNSRVVGTVLFVNSANVTGALRFKNCSFTNFVQTGTISGGPIYIQNTGETAKVSFSECEFSGNQCNTGGAVYINTSVKGVVEFKDGCTFSNNKAASGAGGGCIRARAGSLVVDNCSFEGLGIENSSTVTAGNGGAIQADGATLDIRGSRFSNFMVTTSGAAIYASNEAYISNCSFTSNKAKGTNNTSGGIIYVHGTGKILVANSTLSGCASGGDSSAIFITNTSGTIYIVSCTMSDCTTQIISRGVTHFHIYNSILLGGTALAGGADNNIKRSYSIYGDKIYTTVNTASSLGEFALSAFNSTKGVYPLNGSYSAQYNTGMTVEQLQNETYNITLTDDQKALLAKDQKGNDRTGTIMGAYVLTE